MDLLHKIKHELTDDEGGENILINKNIVTFPSIFDNLPTPVTYITPDHHYHYVNNAYADLYNLRQEDVMGKPVKEFLGEEVYAVIKPYMDRAFKGESVHYETEISLKIGKRFIEATYTPDFDKKGNVVGYLALIRDVTEKKKLEKKLKESRSHYEQLINGLPAAI